LSLQEISEMTLADREALTKAVKSLEHPSLAARLTNLVGKPIELVGYALPSFASKAIASATSKGLQAGPLIAASKKLANRLLVSSGKPGIFVRGLTHGYRAPEHVVSRKKLFGSTLKTSAVFLSGFLSPKRKELGGRT
jgi:hypothetical protein